MEFFEKNGIRPDTAVGDFDSLSVEGQNYLKTLTDTEVIRLRPEKDDSDTQSAACFAMDRGAKRIVILGATGNRIDHLLANFGLLVLGKERGAEISLLDPWNYMKLISEQKSYEALRTVRKVRFFFFSGRRRAGADSERLQISTGQTLSKSL